ncbi:MAG TPA: DNA topoisomerase IV subunit B [Fibrobacteria bacterium]|nr:DNA topoisomerase IV subunit B [Fibrobacteria bacterium]
MAKPAEHVPAKTDKPVVGRAGGSSYDESSIKSLDWIEHIRLRPGMYIGKLGNGSSPDDGIYVLFKEIVDNTIDEFVMGAGKQVDISLAEDGTMSIRDYGRGIPLGKVIDCVSKINTGGKYDGEAFKKSVGLNGVGSKAVNALAAHFRVQSFRDGRTKTAVFAKGVLVQDEREKPTQEPNGTLISFTPDSALFPKFAWVQEFLEERIWYYAYLNAGLAINFNGQKFVSKNGLHDLLTRHTDDTKRYPIIHFKDDDLEAALTHDNSYGERYYSFVNGQFTTEGGTHLAAFREGIIRACKDFFKKEFEPADIRASIVGAISIRMHEPVFESQTKTKLGSTTYDAKGGNLRQWIVDFTRKHLEQYLHKNPDTAKEMLAKIQQNEKERKDMAGIRRLANERAKKASLHNKKLRDCNVHFNSSHKRRDESCIFITEGDSASGSITKARDVNFQAVFSLKGKPLNCYGMTKKVVYENEEFNLLQHALNIEDSLEDLRYNRIIVATDADVDGAHIRLLLLTFFLQYFPELVARGHIHILQTPLFRVRNKKETLYCYSEAEKQQALGRLGKNAEITRFKGLGEISPDEFAGFIGKDIRLEPVMLAPDAKLHDLLEYYMGKNTPTRRDFIMENLRIEEDVVEDKEAVLASQAQDADDEGADDEETAEVAGNSRGGRNKK